MATAKNTKPQNDKKTLTEEELARKEKIKNRINWALFLGAVLIFFIVNNINGDDEPGAYPPYYNPLAPKAGTTAPELNLVSLDGDSLSLAQFKGKPVILTFWTTWNSPSLNTMKTLQTIYQQSGEESLAVVAVSLDEVSRGDLAKQAVEPFVKDNNITFPVAHGNAKLAEKYGKVTTFPTTFVIDSDGKVASRFNQQVSPMVYMKTLSRLAAINK